MHETTTRKERGIHIGEGQRGNTKQEPTTRGETMANQKQNTTVSTQELGTRDSKIISVNTSINTRGTWY